MEFGDILKLLPGFVITGVVTFFSSWGVIKYKIAQAKEERNQIKQELKDVEEELNAEKEYNREMFIALRKEREDLKDSLYKMFGEMNSKLVEVHTIVKQMLNKK
jgi:hypothetical protein